jgi:hypothetical protein
MVSGLLGVYSPHTLGVRRFSQIGSADTDDGAR